MHEAIWKGSIAFGLVNVPVKLYSATEDHDIGLHQVHNKDGGRIRYQRKCEICSEVVAYEDIDKAYEEEGRTVVLTSAELKSLPEENSREIEVVEFIPPPSSWTPPSCTSAAISWSRTPNLPRRTCFSGRRWRTRTGSPLSSTRCGRRPVWGALRVRGGRAVAAGTPVGR